MTSLTPYLCNAYAQLSVTVHYYSLVWLIENVCNTRADVGEQSNRVSEEVSRTQDSVQLPDHFLSIVINDPLLQDRHRQSHIFDRKKVHLEWGVVDVADGHGECVEDDGQRVVSAQPYHKLL